MSDLEQVNEYKSEAKKRLMFLTEEDFYFITYNLLLALKVFDADNGRFLKHPSKLAYIIDFSARRKLTEILVSASTLKNKGRFSEMFLNSYIRGRSRTPIVNRLIYSLEKRGTSMFDKPKMVSHLKYQSLIMIQFRKF